MPVLTTLGAATAKAWGFLQQVAAAADPYFNYVTMLLTGNGTNGAQNNTFLDSSSNAFSITRNGNTTQGSFSPYGSLWSNSFNGTSTFGLSASSAYKLDSDFTIEGWVNSNPYTDNYQTVISIGNGYGGSNNIIIYFNRSDLQNKYKVTIDDVEIINGSITVAVGVWSHFALVRSGTSLKLYVNGALDTSTTKSGTVFSSNPIICIGAETTSSTNTRFNGYISNLRITNTVVYSTTFTPSTTPLTAVSGTQLLTCQSNRFIDNSSNASALTVNGTPSVQRFSPFNPTASYDTATIGGSGYFDGSGDYLTVPDNAAFSLGSNNFTLEAWVYAKSAPSYALVCGQFGPALTSSSDRAYWIRFYSTTGQIQATVTTDGSTETTITASSALALNSWHHVAFVRNGNNLYLYIDGVQAGTTAFSSSVYNSGQTFSIGAANNGNEAWNGYISNVRLVNGTAVYTSAFTPPTAPLTAVSNTSLLTSMINAGIPDSAMMNDLETVGNAQVSTSVKKFGTGSLYFDGTGDYLQIKNVTTSFLNWSSNDYTVEYWIYANSFTQGSNNESVIIGNTDPSAGTNYWTFGPVTNGTVKFYYYSGSVQSFSTTTTLSTGQWYHLAFVNYGGALSIYINGVSSATATISGTPQYSTSYPLAIGASGGTSFNGYIDDLRITKGYARYTSAFTPPTTAFPTY